jgi:hypothetical protein
MRGSRISRASAPATVLGKTDVSTVQVNDSFSSPSVILSNVERRWTRKIDRRLTGRGGYLINVVPRSSVGGFRAASELEEVEAIAIAIQGRIRCACGLMTKSLPLVPNNTAVGSALKFTTHGGELRARKNISVLIDWRNRMCPHSRVSNGPLTRSEQIWRACAMPSLPWLSVCAFLLASWQFATSARPILLASESTPQGAPVAPAAEPSASVSARAVQVRNGPSPGSLELRVNGTVDLAPELIVERQRADGSFEPLQNLDLGSMKLVTSCDQRINMCVRVDEHGLRPVPWSGMSCSSQCNHTCDKNVRLYGRFRFVVRSCDGETRFEGPVFELPKMP